MIDHEYFMKKCLEIAEHGRGLVGNGAKVGAVLVREDGQFLDNGWHYGFGEPHAERQLLLNFDQKIRSTDILYVNLEPCCHQGKTPPCTDIILERGIKKIVIGMKDPDPRVAGKGIELLRSNGVEIIGPVLPQECEWLNRGFVSVRTKGRPWITLKQARTQSGEIANSDGSPLTITSEEQNIWSHTFLRGKHDAILVGVGTVISDNPLLNTRFDQYKKGDQLFTYRLVLDKNCEIPILSRILTDDNYRNRSIVIVSPQADSQRKKLIADTGARVMEVALDDQGLFDWQALWNQLCTPSENYDGLTSLLVEGGRKTWEHFKEAGMMDEEVILVGK